MQRRSVRAMLGSLAVGACLATPFALAGVPLYADTILINGHILTADTAFAAAQAVAIKDGKFLAVGTTRAVNTYRGPATQLIDLHGKTVVPGLIDTYAHMEQAGIALYTVPLYRATNAAQALDLIKEQARQAQPGEWVIGSGWHPPSQLKEKRYLTRQELDSVSPENPVYLPTVGHVVMVNSAALKLAGITSKTPNPRGGEIERGPDGEATGVLQEAAIGLVKDFVPPWPFEVQVTQFREAMKIFNAAGLTSVVVGASSPEDLRVYETIHARHQATVRAGIMFMPTGETIPSVSVDEWETTFRRIGVNSGFGDDWLRLAAIKLAIDGGMTLKTAFMREAYADDLHYHGIRTMQPEFLRQLVATCAKYGWRVGVHVVGDAGVDTVLDAYEFASQRYPIGDKRFILIHGSRMRPDQMQRAHKLGVRVDMQNVFMWTKAETVARFLGKEVADRAVPTRSLIDILGIENVGAGTDYSTNVMNPFINMYVMVTRKDINGNVYGKDQRVTREEALRLYTSSAARYTFEEGKKGSIEAGKLADLVVLSDNLMTVADERIKDIKPLLTVVGGKTVFGDAKAL
ncbi:amidohydrolase [Cupriavidus sp. 8B]